MSWRDIPALLRHCVVAVYSKSTGGGPDGVVRAFKICRDKLAKHGYMYARGQNQILESIQLTGKGYLRNLRHTHEGGGAKDISFSKLFQMVEPRLYEYDGVGGKQAPRPQPSMDGAAPDEEAANVVDDASVLGRISGMPDAAPKNNPPKKLP